MSRTEKTTVILLSVLDNSDSVTTELKRCRSSCLHVCWQENEKQDAFQSKS